MEPSAFTMECPALAMEPPVAPVFIKTETVWFDEADPEHSAVEPELQTSQNEGAVPMDREQRIIQPGLQTLENEGAVPMNDGEMAIKKEPVSSDEDDSGPDDGDDDEGGTDLMDSEEALMDPDRENLFTVHFEESAEALPLENMENAEACNGCGKSIQVVSGVKMDCTECAKTEVVWLKESGFKNEGGAIIKEEIEDKPTPTVSEEDAGERDGVILQSYVQQYKQVLSLHSWKSMVQEEAPYVCPECGKSFMTSARLKMHSIVHSDLRAFQCVECGMTFRRKGDLKVHLDVHKGERNFPCCICGKRYAHKKDLRRHYLLHTGFTPFACSVCDKKFCDYRLLRRHSIIHSSERPYTCNQCEKSFRTNYALKEHIAIHVGEKTFSCNDCDRKFIRKSHLIEHSVVHTTEKAFACTECPSKFGTKCRLKKHLTIHVRDKTLSCSECGKKFVSKHGLRGHFKSFHSRYVQEALNAKVGE